MTLYNENDAFSGSIIYDLQDLVKGGSDGTSNQPLESLFDRTVWLKNRLWAYDGIQTINTNAAIDNSIIGKMISANATSNNIILTLDTLSDFPYGYVLPIKASCSGLKNITIQAATNENIFLNNSYIENVIYMHDGEVLYLLRDAGTWTVLSYKGNFERIGDCLTGYVQQQGTVVRNGQAINRADTPRLWKWINEKLTYGQQVLDDSTWQTFINVNGVSIPAYQGCFSRGNGSTTFRVPDDRGCFDRYLDMNRGLDVSRYFNYPGGYEPDTIKAHSHTMTFGLNGNGGAGSAWAYMNISHQKGTETATTSSVGSNETCVKNTAKIPLIIY